MSVQSTPPTDTCPSCNQEFQIAAAVNGSFCSRKCWLTHRGEKALKTLRHDHRLCSTCGARIKRTEGPSQAWADERGSPYETTLNHGGELHNTPLGMALDATEASQRKPIAVDSIIGYEYHTTDATEGVDGEERPTGEATWTRISCTCGNVDPSEEIEELREIHTARTLANVYKRLVEKYDTGELDQRINKQRYFDAYKDTSSLAYAVGVGLHS